MEPQTTTTTAAYFAFKTLTNMVVKMEEHGPPNRVDRTFLSEMSGAGQTQFIAGLKALGLLDEDGRVQPRLTELVSNPEDRPKIIGQILRERYPKAVALGEGNATTGELVEVFKEAHGVQGDTARKAIAFYLQAAKYAGDIPLSPNFKTPTIKTGAGSGKKRGRPAKRQEVLTPPPPPANGLPTGLHPALAGLLGDIPKRGETWTQEQYDDFMAAFKAVIKIAAPIRSNGDGADDDFDPDQEFEESQ
jgi:Family of unknown function (DUF5343)